MSAKLGNGVPAIRYSSKGVVHVATATGYGSSITACNKLAYGKPWEADASEITCKKCSAYV